MTSDRLFSIVVASMTPPSSLELLEAVSHCAHCGTARLCCGRNDDSDRILAAFILTVIIVSKQVVVLVVLVLLLLLGLWLVLVLWLV